MEFGFMWMENLNKMYPRSILMDFVQYNVEYYQMISNCE